ncbi:hypothetical protein ACFU9Y_23490 [Streptomyces sp. NPDC057621]
MSGGGEKTDTDRADTVEEFGEAVNMTPGALKKWLDTDDPKA